MPKREAERLPAFLWLANESAQSPLIKNPHHLSLSPAYAAYREAFFFWAWAVLMVWAPIPLGSNRPWAWALLEMGILLLAALWLIAVAMGRMTIPVTLQRSKWFLLLLMIWLSYQALYMLPMPVKWVAWISPEAAAMHVLAESLNAGTADSWRTLAVDAHAAMVSWLKSLCYVLGFVMTLAVITTRQRAQQFAYTLVLSAMVMAVFGILMHLAEINIDWFGTLIAHGAEASATFANRNHFAGYLEMILAIGIGLLIAGLKEYRAQTWKQFFRHFIEWILSAKMRLRLMLCVMVIALVATHSRMGNTGFFSSLMIAGVIGIALARHAARGTVILLVSLIVIDLFIVGSWFGVDKLAQRLEQTTMTDIEVRQDPSVYALKIIQDYPAVGSGPGSFYTVFPRYRGPDVAALFEYAHNDYAQFAVESGVAGLGLLGLMVAWSLAVALRAQQNDKHRLIRGRLRDDAGARTHYACKGVRRAFTAAIDARRDS